MTPEPDERTVDLRFKIRCSVRYYRRRQQFFKRWSNIAIFIMIIASFMTLLFSVLNLKGYGLEDPTAMADTIIAVASAIIAIVGIVEITVLRIAKRAIRSLNLAGQFTDLAKRLGHGRNLDDEEFEKLTDEWLEIQSKQPPRLALLNVLCWLEILHAYDEHPPIPSIPWWRRQLVNCASQPNYAKSYGLEN